METGPLLRPAAAALVIAVLTAAGTARAEPAKEEYAPASGRVHAGGYFRGSVGVSLFNVLRSTAQRGSGNDPVFGGRESSIRAFVPTFDLSLGGLVASRVAVAGFVHYEWLPDTDVKLRDGSRYPLDGPLYFVIVGPEIDVERLEDGGWHFGLGAGFAAMSASIPGSTFQRLGGLGAGVQLSLGYDWWVGPRTGLGCLLGARIAQVGASREAGAGSVEEVNTMTGFSLSVTVLQH